MALLCIHHLHIQYPALQGIFHYAEENRQTVQQSISTLECVQDCGTPNFLPDQTHDTTSTGHEDMPDEKPYFASHMHHEWGIIDPQVSSELTKGGHG